MNICVQAIFQVEGKTNNKIKQNFTGIVEKHLFLVYFVFFAVLDIDITRDGNNLKLKVRFEFSLSMDLMLRKHICDRACENLP